MTRALSILVLSGFLSLAAPALMADEAGVEAVISDQIAAFQTDDFDAAFEYASPSIRAIFQTPERFGAMVQQGYPMVHRPAGLRFLEQSRQGGMVVQRVMITDAQGRLHMLEYQMLATETGFLINGVRLLPPAGPGV